MKEYGYDTQKWKIIRMMILKWYDKFYEDFENNPQSAIDKFNYNNNQPSDNEHTEKELTKILNTKYKKEFIRFAKNIAEENADEEVIYLIKK